MEHRADVILDVMGAKYLADNINSLAPDGRLVVIGMQGGVKAELNLGALLSKGGTVVATSLRGRSEESKAAICEAVVRDVWPLFESGQIRPVIDSVLPLDQAAEAHGCSPSRGLSARSSCRSPYGTDLIGITGHRAGRTVIATTMYSNG